MPFFSIIIPTYNRAHIIGKAISSVLTQAFTDFELIIIDDGSTDHTKYAVTAFKDDRIQYTYQVNSERGKSRNNGVKIAKGEYVFFLDSDDFIYPNHLENAYACIQKIGTPAFFSSRYESIYAHKKTQHPALNQNTVGAQIKKQNLFACQFFTPRTIALQHPFSENRDLKIGEDWEVILKIAARHQLHISNEITAAIVHHGERSMEVANTATILASRDVLIANLKQDNAITADVFKNVYTELTTLAALSAGINQQKKQAIIYWWQGITTQPRHIFKRRTLAIFKKIISNGRL